MSDRPRILFATIAAGGGHVAAAQAMAEAVAALEPGAFELSVSDLMHDLGLEALDRRHKEQWRLMLAHPWTVRAGQRLVDTFPAVTRTVLRLGLDGVARAAAQHLRGLALVVANHGFLAVALTRARDRYGLATPVLVTTAELFDTNALWAEPRAERFIVPSDRARDDLIRLGVPASRVDVVGYPVRQAFLHAPPRAAARARLDLPERFTVLVSLGGEGVAGDAAGILDTLGALPSPPQVLVLAGRNAGLAAALRARAQPGVVVRDFVDDVAAHVAASDVVVGKAGPNSVWEVVAVGRPMLVTRVAGLNEVRVLEYLVRSGLGHDVRGPGALARQVAAYQAAPEAGEAVAARAGAVDVAAATERVARTVIDRARAGLRQGATP